MTLNSQAGISSQKEALSFFTECCSGVDIDHATRTPVKEVYTFGDTVTYQCIAGNVGTGTPLMTITCEDCQWSDSLPTCTGKHFAFSNASLNPNHSYTYLCPVNPHLLSKIIFYFWGDWVDALHPAQHFNIFSVISGRFPELNQY